jgi:hypothetical protein
MIGRGKIRHRPDSKITVLQIKKMLDTLKERLSITSDFAEQALRNKIENKQNAF